MSWMKLVYCIRKWKIAGRTVRGTDRVTRQSDDHNVDIAQDQLVEGLLPDQRERKNIKSHSDKHDCESKRERIEQPLKCDRSIEEIKYNEWTHEKNVAYYLEMEKYYYKKYRSLGFSDGEIEDIIIRIFEDR
jgi:hypothetical protein